MVVNMLAYAILSHGSCTFTKFHCWCILFNHMDCYYADHAGHAVHVLRGPELLALEGVREHQPVLGWH